jgi:hypothetical protein
MFLQKLRGSLSLYLDWPNRPKDEKLAEIQAILVGQGEIPVLPTGPATGPRKWLDCGNKTLA